MVTKKQFEDRVEEARLWDAVGDESTATLADHVIAALSAERDEAVALLHRYVDGLPPQKPTSTDGDTQEFLARIHGGA